MPKHSSSTAGNGSDFIPGSIASLRSNLANRLGRVRRVLGENTTDRLIDAFWVVLVVLTHGMIYRGFEALLDFYRGHTAWSVYEAPSFLIRSLSYPEFFVPVTLGALGFLLLWKRNQWNKLEHPALRWLITFIVVLLSLYLGLGEYNYFWDRGFWLDRAVLLAAALGVAYHPFFVFPMLLVLGGFYAQVRLPFGRFHAPFFSPLYQMVILFFSYLVLRGIRKLPTRIFLVALLSLVGTIYFVPGLSKVLASPNGLEWVLEYRLDYAAAQSYFLGWWWWNEELFWTLVAFLRTYLRPMIVLTLLLELLAVMVFWSRKGTLILIGGFILFHAVTFTVVGFLFWKLTLVLLGLAVVLQLIPRRDRTILYHPVVGYTGIALIVLAPLLGYFRSRRLTWWETRYQTRFDLVAEVAGEDRRLSYASLAPYDESLGRGFLKLHQLVDRPIILSQATDAATARLINRNLEDEGDLRALENQLGQNFYDRYRANQIRYFLRRYLRNFNGRTPLQDTLDGWLRWLRPPRYVQHTGGPEYTNLRELDAPVTALEIRRVQGVTRDESVPLLRDRLVEVLRLR